MAESILTGGVRNLTAISKRDPGVALMDMQHAEIERLKAELDMLRAMLQRLTEEKAAATEAAATERGRAMAAEARAGAAERLLSAETKRADDEEAECKKYEAQCEQLRQQIIAEVESRARAEGAAKQVVMPSAPQAVPPTPIGWTMKATRFDEIGNIVEMTLIPTKE